MQSAGCSVRMTLRIWEIKSWRYGTVQMKSGSWAIGHSKNFRKNILLMLHIKNGKNYSKALLNDKRSGGKEDQPSMAQGKYPSILFKCPFRISKMLSDKLNFTISKSKIRIDMDWSINSTKEFTSFVSHLSHKSIVLEKVEATLKHIVPSGPYKTKETNHFLKSNMSPCLSLTSMTLQI